MRYLIMVPWGVVIAMFGATGQMARADLGSEQYFLPVAPPYAVCRTATDSRAEGRYKLVEMEVFPSKAVSFHTLVPAVEQIAVSGKIIMGKTGNGFFLLDANKPDPTPQLFASAEDWQSAMSNAGISPVPQLNNPDTLASAMPDMTLRPWRYRNMKGLWGHSDNSWAGMVQLVGFLIALLIGVFSRSKTRLVGLAILGGLIVDLLAQFVIAGDGPAAFVGLFVLPIFFCMLAHLGHFLRRMVLFLTVKRLGPSAQGRSMI